MSGGGIDSFIDQRAARLGNEAAEARARVWRESAEKHEEREREKNRMEWVAFYQRLSDLHIALAARHRERARRLQNGGADAQG